MNSVLRMTTLSSIILAFASQFYSQPCFGEQKSFRMPQYANGEPPAARTRDEVAKLLAGATTGKEKAAESARSPMQIVLVAGPKDHGTGEHDYPAWQKVWSRLLAEAPATKVETAWEFPSSEQIDRADVLVFYQRGRWDAERASAIDPFLARGGGLVYIHWAVDGRGQQDEMSKRIGLSALGDVGFCKPGEFQHRQTNGPCPDDKQVVSRRRSRAVNGVAADGECFDQRELLIR
jgi:hypothetical protein